MLSAIQVAALLLVPTITYIPTLCRGAVTAQQNAPLRWIQARCRHYSIELISRNKKTTCAGRSRVRQLLSMTCTMHHRTSHLCCLFHPPTCRKLAAASAAAGCSTRMRRTMMSVPSNVCCPWTNVYLDGNDVKYAILSSTTVPAEHLRGGDNHLSRAYSGRGG